MQGRLGRLWRFRRGWAATVDSISPPSDAMSVAEGGVTDSDGLALPDPDRPSTLPPEQPVLLMPSGGTRPVHVGELLPARRRPWPLALVRLPTVSKRAILAAGICAGLAAPGLARHLATRIFFARPSVRAEGVLEITRIVYVGPLTPRTAAAIGKALTAGRR